MVAESFIRALELRMDQIPAARAKESVDTFYRAGLLLTPYFYSVLDGYERSDVSLPDSFLQMARNIQLRTEEARFRDTFSKIPVPQKSVARAEVPQAPPEPEPNPVGDLLKQAQTAFNGGDMVKARNLFERVLSDFDRDNGAAEYGLGLVASRVGYSEEARQHFERAIHSTSAEPGMKVWSYIYLAEFPISSAIATRPSSITSRRSKSGTIRRTRRPLRVRACRRLTAITAKRTATAKTHIKA